MKKRLKAYISTEDITVAGAMSKIDAGGKGILFIVDDKRVLVGCITDGDIRRWLIKTADFKALATKFMCRNPKCLFVGDDIDAESFMNEHSISAIPYVDSTGAIIDIKFRNDSNSGIQHCTSNSLSGVPVVIMAGGKGTRLYPFTKILPKPLIPIGEIPILERIVDRFVDKGVTEFYFTVNYKKNMIKSYFEEISDCYTVNYVEEEEPLGTGGSLRLITRNFDKPLFVTNCDILIQANLTEIYYHHLNSGNAMTIVSSLKNTVIPYGVMYIKENGIIDRMEEKPTVSHFINTGMYIINPDIIDIIPKNTFYHMPQLAEECMARGLQVGMYPISEDAFLDMGQFEEMKRMEAKLEV